MDFQAEVWTPATVQVLQDAYRSVFPALTDEDFAQDVLRIAPRTLYNWRSRPQTKLRKDVKREMSRALSKAPSAVVARYREMRPLPTHALAGASDLSVTTYPSALDAAVTTLIGLAESSAEHAIYRPDDLLATVLDWLTSAVGQAVVTADGGRVTRGNVEQVRTMISAIDTIERRAGGADCRATARRYLHEVALPMLQREIETHARSELFSAVAELCEIVGWMYYDAGHHGLGQAYFTQALRLTREVGDHALSAYLLTSITHQALHVGSRAPLCGSPRQPGMLRRPLAARKYSSRLTYSSPAHTRLSALLATPQPPCTRRSRPTNESRPPNRAHGNRSGMKSCSPATPGLAGTTWATRRKRGGISHSLGRIGRPTQTPNL